MERQVPQTEIGPGDGGGFEYAWQGDFIEAHLLSDVGQRREKNEDSCIITVPDDADLLRHRGMLFAVADGMGGASAGERASHLTLEVLSRQYFASTSLPIPAALEMAIEAANAAVFDEAEHNPELHGMGTTVSVVVIHGENAYIGQVGDSRVYLLRERAGIHQITRDHSLVAEQVRNGLITEEEARHHQLKNLITRAVGIKERVKIDLFAMRLQAHDTLLICSDGLCNMVSDEELAHGLALGALDTNTRGLVKLANDAGGTDNITAVTLRVSTSPPRRPLHEGADQVSVRNGGFWGKLKGLFA
ncbi:MAG: Stp1/IreP family PP2C-type Ser/Thr phosphatase [Candidatus Hydrogenedens sp.]|nr:Stp1/IreP family PP2C-type Ser/Thr phosphatase [Candidatus Hydrogenedens sp.]